MKILILSVFSMLFGSNTILFEKSEIILNQDNQSVEYLLSEVVKGKSSSFTLEFDYQATCVKKETERKVCQNSLGEEIAFTQNGMNYNADGTESIANPFEKSENTCAGTLITKIDTTYPCSSANLYFVQNSLKVRDRINFQSNVEVYAQNQIGLKSPSFYQNSTKTKNIHVKLDYTFEDVDSKISLSVKDNDLKTTIYEKSAYGELSTFDGLIFQGKGFCVNSSISSGESTPNPFGSESCDEQTYKIPLTFNNFTLSLIKPVSTVSFPVVQGWNLKGIESSVTDLSTIFNSECVRTVWTYKNGGWKAFYPSQNGSNLNTLEKYDGFWINAKQDCQIGVHSLTSLESRVPPNFN